MTLLPFLRMLVLLVIEGAAIAAFLLPAGSWLLPLSLALPIAALTNVLIVFPYTITGVSLSEVTISLGHFIILITTLILGYKNSYWIMHQQIDRTKETGKLRKFLLIVCGIFLLMNVAYSFPHAVMMPSNQYDSMTNWTMRSQISFVDKKMAFDADEERGMAKPQYPFLYHALQITANQGQNLWNDNIANAILYLLSISTFWALYLLVRKLRGTVHSVVTITAIIGIPLLGLHLAQGYGDLNLVQYLLLSLACLGMWVEDASDRKRRWLILSGIFVAAAIWTKSEGPFFGLAPWLVTVALMCGKNKKLWNHAIIATIVLLALSFAWPLFAWSKGFLLTPHSSDTMLGFHPEGLREAFLGLFSRGSFGPLWYALVFLIPVMIAFGIKKNPTIQKSQLMLLAWGGLLFAEILFIYLFTPNVRFLLNGESYYRQMMMPAALFVLACGFCIRSTKQVASE